MAAAGMKKFYFSSNQPATTFTGRNFYNIYKTAEFLGSSQNIETILSKGYELRKMLKDTSPGEMVLVEGMSLERNTPLYIKKTGPDVKVEEYEFTHNRLTGFVAAYTFENSQRFPNIISSEAMLLGLTWDNTDEEKCKLYLSAVTGTEHFYDQFSFWPLVCAVRKLQMKKITPELVVKMARIKNNDGERLAKDFKDNYKKVVRLWKCFKGASSADLDFMIVNAPEQVKKAFELEE